MKKQSILYGVIGLLIGGIVTWFVIGYSINNGYGGMMGMMGVNSSYMNRSNIDEHFIEQMIPHHESAIAMAKVALEKSKHEEVKTLAGNIISSQTAEINTMKEWYKDWYGTEVPVVSEGDMWGGGMMHAEASAEDLSTAADFDKAFLTEMIEHHQMAVLMANMLENSTTRPEMKKLANDIVAEQNKEINDMQTWQEEWGYETTRSDAHGMMRH